MRHWKLNVVVALSVLCTAVAAQEEEGLSATDEMIEAARQVVGRAGEHNLTIGATVDHHDADGYPEDAQGRLVLTAHADGPAVYLPEERAPYLLYAQYVNTQRDAVFLARTGAIRDTTPGGDVQEIPYGYGAVKLNAVRVSIVESLLIPHFSDNAKSYQLFPLNDLYVGASFSLSGITAMVRYVGGEQLVAYSKIGFNPFGTFIPGDVRNQYWVPIHVGFGYRFPGAFPELLGENVWTVGGETMVGLGDRDGDPATGIALLSGPYIDIERVLYDEAGRRRDFRTDPRPYNYRVNSLSLRLGLYFNIGALTGTGNLLVPSLGLTYQLNVLGPPIPEHEFKETKVLYVNELYLEDLERQRDRREARENR